MSTLSRREIEQFRKAAKEIDAERLKEAIEKAARVGAVCFEGRHAPDNQQQPGGRA